MWIVRLALKRPYTFVVMALLIVALGGVAIMRMPTDIFPNIDIPVVSVIWTYSGIAPEEMAEVVTIRCERAFTTSVNDIEHQESQSLPGLSVIRVFFQPDAKVDAAVAQLAASSQSVLHSLPPGMTPPSIIRYNASSVPILQLGLSSETMGEQELYDYGYNFIRTQLSTVQGASFPLPYGGKPRQIMVDLNPEALYAQNLSPQDVVNAINDQSIILPSGSVKIGSNQFNVRLNSLPEGVAAFNNLPIKVVNGTPIYVRDVAHVRDGFAIQTNIVRHNGRRGSLLTVLKNGSASTLDIVSRLKKILPRVVSTLPSAMKVSLMFDQSIFVRAAINGVLKEAILAALLTGLMILLFLGSWRSTVIVCVSIPLSILTSLAILHLINETVNVMTLGGLALAVGILVDDATVEIENIHRNLAQGKPILRAILDGAQQIAIPAFVSTLCICIVFVPVIFLTGAARYLFTPLAIAVVLAMMASYFLSRTLVPTMVKYLLAAEVDRYGAAEEGEVSKSDDNIFWRMHHAFNHQFHRLREGYRNLLASALGNRKTMAVCFGGLCLACAALAPLIGTDFFPQVDAGQIRLHVRAPADTRIEETEQWFARVEDSIRRVIPAAELSDMIDNIGLPYSGLNIAMSDTATVGQFDGEILVSLNPEGHAPTWDYVRTLRKQLAHDYPNLSFFFQPADIVGQILNFGLPAPIDIQVIGPLTNAGKNYQLAKQIEQQVARIPGAVDVHLHQVVETPELRVNVDRTRAGLLGLTQKAVANGVLVSLSSSLQTNPIWWINPQNGVDYPVVVQTPEYRVDSTSTLMQTPFHLAGGASQMLSNVAQYHRGTTAAVVNHYNVQPLYDVYANVQDRDLGSVASQVNKLLDGVQAKLPKGSFIETRGQVQTMKDSFIGLGIGLVFAILLVYFVMVVNFQSWLDPFIILMALPGALSGILLSLFVTQTTISVPSLMGAIMSIGVATANSILLVNFANELRREGEDVRTAALEAGYTRLRPVLMTALAMVVGMLPMALGLGEGGEQNAPLGRAVIGGLILATIATLFFVPVVYSFLRHKAPGDPEDATLD